MEGVCAQAETVKKRMNVEISSRDDVLVGQTSGLAVCIFV